MGTTAGQSTANNQSGSTGNNEKANPFANMKMPQLDTEVVMNSFKKNLEILGLMNKMSSEVISGIAKVQSAFMKQMITDMGSVMEKGTKPTEAIAKLSEVARDTIVKAIENSKQISSMISTNNNELTSTIAHRLKESIEEAKSAMKK